VQAVYLAPPDHRRKERFRTRSADVIREVAGFQPALLEPFANRLKAAGMTGGQPGATV
jgi:hypothetical protein